MPGETAVLSIDEDIAADRVLRPGWYEVRFLGSRFVGGVLRPGREAEGIRSDADFIPAAMSFRSAPVRFRVR